MRANITAAMIGLGGAHMATRPDDMSDPFDRDDGGSESGGDGNTSPLLRDRVTVLRPRDLLAFSASWHGLKRDGRGGALVAEANGGTLTITFPFQHVSEAARPIDADPPLPPPVAARAARASRLVFTVPAGHVIPYSIDGLLAAMSSLELAVAPAAKGGSQIITWGQAGGNATSLLTQTLTRTAQMRVGPASDKPAGENDRPTLQQLVGLRQGSIAAKRVIAIGGLSAGDLIDPQIRGRITVKLPPVRVPTAQETAIEAPFRLILSPSLRSGWVHARTPVEAKSDRGRVELWHSRLATRIVTGDQVTLDELPDGQRTLRAIWTRDRDRTVAESPGFPRNPFTGSLRADQRDLIVEQTAGSVRAPKVLPTPINVRGFALSSLGAFLDLHVQWPWRSYPNGFAPLESWDHVAPMGRDQFVRVVTPGFLYPLGHAAYLVEITYRRVAGTSNPVAGLFRRTFIVLGDPNRPYAVRDLPFIAAQVAPLRTPDLDPSAAASNFFVPHVVGDPQPFQWRVTGLDQDGRPIHLRMPMVWVRALANVSVTDVQNAYQSLSTVPADGQSIAFAPALDGDGGGQASAEVRSLRFDASMTATTATPRLRDAVVIVPAMKRLTPTADPVTVSYADIYKANGFGAGNAGQVYLALADAAQLAFGSSDRSGGFVQPDVTVKGLARSVGLVADLAGAQTGNFDPKLLFAGGFPKLFGLIDLWAIVGSTLLEHAPKFLTDELNKATALLRDLQQLQQLAESGELKDKATALGGQVKAAVDEAATMAKATITAFQSLLAGEADARQHLHDALADLKAKLGALRNEIPNVPLGPGVRAAIDRLIAAIGTALALDDEAAEIEAKLTALVDAVENLANNIDPGGREVRARMEWRPPLQNWPHPPHDPIFRVDGPKKGALVLSVETRVAVGKPPVADVAAELTDFALELLPGAQLMRVHFDRIAFRMTVGRKPEIDVVFGRIEFLGVLGFVNTLAEIIPLDGFSDPPFVDVSTEGVTAGFTLGLPNLAIGIFSLSNLAIAADARIPFLGETVSVGFSFCTREKPFTLAVALLGGGGFFGIRLSPKGVVLLEAALEFGAVVAVDFGVASGSISAMAGIYFRMEGSAASLTGYFRIRGEVDVLSLISASIELYMALTYAFDTGKMVGEATITVHVEVLFFSTSVSIHAQRTFAGSNGDPTAAQMLLPEGGRSTIWEEYCAAFAPAKPEA